MYTIRYLKLLRKAWWEKSTLHLHPFLSVSSNESFLCHIVKVSICNHRKAHIKSCSYRAHMKCEVLCYRLTPLWYLPGHHPRCRKAMVLTRGYPLLTLEPPLFHLWGRLLLFTVRSRNFFFFYKLGDRSSNNMNFPGSAEVSSFAFVEKHV